MASVTQFAQFLLNNEPQKNVARLSLYHFLKNFDYLSATFDENIVKEFYFHSYLYEYWRKNKQSLERVVNECFSQFNRQSHGFHQDKLDHGLLSIQVISLESKSDQSKALEAYLCGQFGLLNTGQTLLKNISITKSRTLCLVKNSDESLEALVFTHHFTVMDGVLVPLAPVTHLKYDAQLELRSKVNQKLELSESMLFRWQQTPGAISGYLVKGYSFQKTTPFQVRQIQDVHDLFLSIKKVESHFLNLTSDPYYKETIHLLEKSIQYLESGDEASVNFASNTLKKAQYILKSIFPHDKLLSLLVSNLEYAIIKSKLSGKEVKPWPKNQEKHLQSRA